MNLYAWTDEAQEKYGVEVRKICSVFLFSSKSTFGGKNKVFLKILLKDSGVCRILLSVDAFHQETIPLEPVKYFAECVSDSGIGISLSPAWLVSESDNNQYNIRTREIIKEFDILNIPVGSGNVVFPSGNALKYLKEYFDENEQYSNPYDENPKDIRTVDFSAKKSPPIFSQMDGNSFSKELTK